MERKRAIWVGAIVIASLLLVGYGSVMNYGDKIGLKLAKLGPPNIDWEDDEKEARRTGQECRVVAHVNPLTHWNWRGEVWQDPYWLWEEIQTLSPAPQELKHGKTGLVRVGDVFCGWDTYGTEATVHRPTGMLLACQTSETEFDPPC